MTPAQRKILLLTSLGSVVEFYDFIIYALLAGTLSQQFFPQVDPIMSLMATFATYAAGYLARPFGGLVFAHYGDTRCRKKPFTFTILMMALATMGIAFVPTYQQIGLLAPILLLLLRIFQGFSLGGETPGAITYICEQIPTQRGLACGIVFAGTSFGAVLGSVVIALLQMTLSPSDMHVWGWRLVFLFGSGLGVMSYAFRRYLLEANAGDLLTKTYESIPLKQVLRCNPREVMVGFMLVALGATTATLLSIYIPAYLEKVAMHPMQNMMWFQAIALTYSGSSSIVVGYLTDRFGPQPFIRLFLLVVSVVAIPVYCLLAYYPSYALMAMLLGTTGNSLAWGCIPRYLGELFPKSVRYTGIALSYNMAFALFGGVTPLIATYLVYLSGQLIAPASILLALVLATGLIFVKWQQPERAERLTTAE